LEVNVYIDQIKTGDRVYISIGRSLHVDWKQAYVSSVEAILEDKRLIVQSPMHMGAIIKLAVNDDCQLCFITARGKILYDARVSENIIEGGLRYTSLRLVGNGEKMQLRDFFRFNCSIPLFFYLLNDEGEPADPEPKAGTIRDIGGGGMRMLSKVYVEPKTIIRAMLQLNEDSILSFGHVLYRDQLENALTPYQYRVKFAAMSKIDQDKIIQFIYNEQRKSLQRLK
jgi:c-di-GMP-binding flagellar brake protein YcgR